MIRVILVRHGETYWNAEGRFQGRIDVELNTNGKRQAQCLADALKGVDVTAIYSSPLKRSMMTAEAIAETHDLEVMPVGEFNEIDHGLWEGSTIAQVREEDGDRYEEWMQHPEKVAFPSGETLADIRARSVKKLNEILAEHKDGDTVVIAAHDATNKVLIMHALDLDDAYFWRIKQGNASINILEYTNGQFTITLLNDTCHHGGVIDETAAGAL